MGASAECGFNLKSKISGGIPYPQQGFTIVELITVIALLGILASTVLPRFIDMKSEARVAVIENVAGTLSIMDAKVYSKSMVLGIHDNDRNRNTTDTDPQGGFFMDGNFIWTVHGRPWLFNGEAASNLLQMDIHDEGRNEATDKVCNTERQFCFMLYSPLGINRGDIAGLGLESFKPGSAVLFYFPGDALEDLCFVYYLYDRDINATIVGSMTSGCG